MKTAAIVAANTAVNTVSPHMLEISENVIYLMGLSFILGSSFSILVLILLDYMQRNNPKK